MTKLLQRLADAKREGWDEWIQNESDERALAEGHYFDLPAAERVRTFFKTFLRHSKGQWARQPFELLDWQWRSVVAPLFGWKRPDGSRRYRRGYIEVPKKNGKSALFSGLSLYLLAGDKEAGAEIYSAAVDRDQASIVFNEAANMVEESPQLTSRLQVVRSTKRIVFHRTRSFYKALSADVPAKEGLNAHAVLIDELHAQRTRDLWDTLRYAGASRRQPLHLSITTAGYDRHSICWEQHDYAQKVLDGVIEDLSFFAFIAGAGDEDDLAPFNSSDTPPPADHQRSVAHPARGPRGWFGLSVGQTRPGYLDLHVAPPESEVSIADKQIPLPCARPVRQGHPATHPRQ